MARFTRHRTLLESADRPGRIIRVGGKALQKARGSDVLRPTPSDHISDGW
jgi:hypothetical protein